MAKYILALIELEDDYALESYRVGQTYPGTAAANAKYAILDSANADNKDAFKQKQLSLYLKKSVQQTFITTVVIWIKQITKEIFTYAKT